MATSGFVDNWQGGKTLTECNRRMLENEDCCDVSFRVWREGHVMKAHRYVLISRSCVFYSMFVGDLAERSEVTIPEIEPQDFMTFLQYIYTDDTTIDPDNVTALLYASRKYAVTGLETRCLHFLEQNLTADNACVILEAAHRFDEKELFQKAMTLIKGQSDAILQSSGFLALSQELVDNIIECDDFFVDEHLIFKAVNKWAEAECGRQGREVTPETKRTILGQTLMKIRFPLMQHHFISDDVKSSGLLTEEERLNVLDYTVMGKADNLLFSCTERKGITCGPLMTSDNRFDSTFGLWGCNDQPDSIQFKCSHKIRLHGFRLYGPCSGEGTYQISSQLFDVNNVKVGSINTTYTGSDKMYDVMYQKPVEIRAGEMHTLEFFIQGPWSFCGDDGIKEVRCSDGVTFNFQSVQGSDTSVTDGQIPALIYRLSALNS